MQAFLSTCCSSYMRQNLPSQQQQQQQQQQQSINQSIKNIFSQGRSHFQDLIQEKKQHLHKTFGQNSQDMIYYSDDVHAVMRGKSVSKKTRNAN